MMMSFTLEPLELSIKANPTKIIVIQSNSLRREIILVRIMVIYSHLFIELQILFIIIFPEPTYQKYQNNQGIQFNASNER
jgi:hypothetical protein